MLSTIDSFATLIGPEKLCQLQKRISQTTGVKAVILDHRGAPVTDLSCLGEFCQTRQETEGLSCREVHRVLYERVMESGQVEIDVCRHSHLCAAALPVFHQDALACVWVLCQFTYTSESGESCRESPVDYQEGVPCLNEAALTLLLNFISQLTEDILELKSYNLQIEDMEQTAKALAYQDRLLGLPNGLCLERDLSRDHHYTHLLVLDVEDMRKINDVYSRECGDMLLRVVRDYLLSLGVPGSKLYRLDNADFGLLVEEQTDEGLLQIGQQITERCGRSWMLNVNGQRQHLFINLHVGVVPVDSSTVFANLYSAIEHALDIASQTEAVALFDDSRSQSFRNRLRLELSLRNAVRENMQGFYLVYQPIVDPGVAVWRGMEALCRWESPEFGNVSPVEFIHIAEATGLICDIGRWVLEQALSQIKAWGLDQVENFVLDVNLSPLQLVDPGLGKVVVQLLEQYQYPAHKLCLEITESSEFDFSKHAMQVIDRLTDIGVVIALDDFGTGYASFHSLHKLPVSILKTDRSLVNGLENDSFLKRLFYVMVEMAHASDMKIVAEGVETDTQARLLLKEGADYFQGYNFSRPLSVEDMSKNLDNFQRPSGDLVAMGYTRIDLSRLSDEQGGYQLTPSLYQLLNRCMRTLFASPSNKSIDTALSLVGEALQVSRAYVFQKDAKGCYSNTHEWCAPGVSTEKEHLQKQDIEQMCPEWMRTLREDGMLVAADIRMLDQCAFGVLVDQGIKAVVEFPIWREDQLFGFVGFDDCTAIHFWTREEIQMLHTLTSIISSTLSKIRLRERLSTQNERMINMLNKMDTLIFVSDPFTDEILFVNTEMQQSRPGQTLVGEPCWKALQGKEQRCSFCPVPHLLENPEENYHWEYYNDAIGSHIRSCDSMIPWDGNQLAHFSYALNITDLKQYELHQEKSASNDPLTQTLNRNSFLQAARILLGNSNGRAVDLSVAYVDIDDFKSCNQQHGSAAGDHVICTVADVLRKNMRQSDLIGRFGSDEFVILFQGCSREQAMRSLTSALEDLRAAEEETLSFSFGVSDTSELPEDASNHSKDRLERLIELADQRMSERRAGSVPSNA